MRIFLVDVAAEKRPKKALHIFICDVLEIRKLKDENSGAPLFVSRPPRGGTPCASWWGRSRGRSRDP